MSVSYSIINSVENTNSYPDGGGAIFMGAGQKFVFYKMDVSNVKCDYAGIYMRVIFKGPKIVALSTIHNITNTITRAAGIEIFDYGYLSFRESNRTFCQVVDEVCFHCYLVQGLISNCNFLNNSCNKACGFFLRGSQVNMFRTNILYNKLDVTESMVYSYEGTSLIYYSIVRLNDVNCYFKGVNGNVMLFQCEIDRESYCEGVFNANYLPFQEVPNVSFIVQTIECPKCDVCSAYDFRFNIFSSKYIAANVFIFNLKEP